jgi:Ser/Thr protein kinase RdoA (MazF antagonist)
MSHGDAFFDEAAEDLLRRYKEFDGCSVEPLCYSENRTYRVRAASGMPVATLRLCRPGYRTFEQLQAEVAWLAQIHRDPLPQGFEVIEPLAADDGSHVQVLQAGESGEREPDGHLFGLAFRYMTGVEPDEERCDLPRLFRGLGALAATLHSRPCADAIAQARGVWDFQSVLGPGALWGDWHVFQGFYPEDVVLLERCVALVRERLASYGMPQGRYGLIHSDMRFANLLVDGGKIKLLDFDDSARSWHLFDLAASLSFIEARPDVPELVESWLQGYRGIRTLDEADLAMIPTFIVMRRLQLTAWLASRHDSDPVAATLPGWAQDTVSLCRRYLGE